MSIPAGLDLAARQVVVCGAGPAALGPVGALLDAQAEVTVVGGAPATTLRDLADRRLITWIDREVAMITADDLAGAALVVPASGNADLDQELMALSRQCGVLAVQPASGLPRSTPSSGSVILVGGGPGDPGLITVAGLDAIRTADVLVCDRLAPHAVLQEAKPGAEIIDVAKIPKGAATSQERINAVLVDRARAGLTVVRFKGGDNFVFGRGGEEWQACADAGIPVTVIPGVSSATAAPALAGVPLTHRNLTQGFTVVSGHAPPGDPGSTLDWPALARSNTTLVIMMGVATLPAITAELIKEGMPAETPAMTVADAGLPTQKAIFSHLADIAAATKEAGIRPPAITVIGSVVNWRG
jgi:uroporphyrin-III C-methyltransferase